MARIDIPFIVDKQIITQPNRDILISGGRNYFYATFTTCDVWDDVPDIKAVFYRDDITKMVSLEVGEDCYECEIPWEVMAEKGTFQVGIFGGDRLLTDVSYVTVKQGCITIGDPPIPPTEDWLSKLEKDFVIKQLFSNAVNGSTSGYMLSLDDISPFEHEIGVAVRSKNLLQTQNIQPLSSWTDKITIDGDTITVEKAREQPMYGVKCVDVVLEIGKTYTFSVSSVSDHASYWGWRLTFEDGTTSPFSQSTSYTVTITKPVKDINFFVGSPYEGTEPVYIIGMQIEEGSAVTPYAPYIDVSQLSVIKTGKNMAFFNGGKSFRKTEQGLTIDYDAELQLFTLNGTLSSDYEFYFGSLFDLYGYSAYDGKEQTLSLIYEGGTVSSENCELGVVYGECHKQYGDMVTGACIKLAEKSASSTGTSYYGVDSYFEDLCLWASEDVTFTDYKFELQLEAGNGTEYEPAKAEKFSLAESTEFATMSHTPTTNICVQVPYQEGMWMYVSPIIDCKYNQNINSVIEKLTNAIIALGGNV